MFKYSIHNYNGDYWYNINEDKSKASWIDYLEPSTVLVKSSEYKAGDRLDLHVRFKWSGRPF